MDLAIFLGFVALLVTGAVVLTVRQRRKQREIDAERVRKKAALSTAPYWVGISVYEGTDRAAAEAAFKEMQGQYHTLPGNREMMQGDSHVLDEHGQPKFFKVV